MQPQDLSTGSVPVRYLLENNTSSVEAMLQCEAALLQPKLVLAALGDSTHEPTDVKGYRTYRVSAQGREADGWAPLECCFEHDALHLPPARDAQALDYFSMRMPYFLTPHRTHRAHNRSWTFSRMSRHINLAVDGTVRGLYDALTDGQQGVARSQAKGYTLEQNTCI